MYSRVRVGRTLEYVLPQGVAYSRVGPTPYPGVVYYRVRSTKVWRTLEYATTKEECTLESKRCLESVVAPTTDPLNYHLMVSLPLTGIRGSSMHNSST